MSGILFHVLYYLLFACLTAVILYLAFDKLNSCMDQQVVEIEGMHYMVPVFNGFQKDPKAIKDIGSVLVCESLAEIMNQKVKMNYPVPEARSITTGNNIYADCYHQETDILVDYLPEAHHKFNGPDLYNDSEYDFYDRHLLEQIKRQKAQDNKMNLIQVPYTIDMCSYNEEKDMYDCKNSVPREKRKEKIKEYLRKEMVRLF
jgi:hypothetical protein